MESDVRPLKRLRTSEDEFENYDVFISHRGPDTKIGFAGFLHDGFKSVGLRSFLDFESIGMGQGSWACIERAIKSSPIVVVIFSKNYAESKWCMKELHLTMEIPNIKVLPVFYKVEPWEVRNPEAGQLKDGFAKLKDRVAKSKDGQSASCIANWKEALKRASELRGVKCKDGDQRLEKDIVKEIAEMVSKWANKLLPLDVGQHVVGVDTVAQEIIQRLDQEKSVKLLGLWGMGGIGKSTLARELYNCLQTRFGASSFIEDVTDKLGFSGGVAKVQSRILKDLCKDCNGVEDKSSGKGVLEKRLCEKKILLVLDDVHDMEHLVSRKMLGDGSLCIVTSRDKRLFEEACSFVSNQVYIHDVQGLGNEASKQVFTSYAFGGGFSVKKELEELVLYISTACGGVPLVLKVCGALLKNENDIAIWKDVLKQLQCGSIVEEKKIFECLRISYDALQAQQKDMFLDIACALLGQSKDYAIKIWTFKRWRAASGVRNLVKKALVIVDEYGCFCMHDLIRDMGRTIVQMERMREGVIRRLWEPESSEYLMGDETWPKSLQTLVIIYPLNDKVGDSSLQLDFSTLKDLYVLRCFLYPMTTLTIPKNLLWFSCIGTPFVHMSRFLVPQSSELMILDLGQHYCKTMYESLKDASELEVVNLSQITRLHWLPSSLRDLKVWQASGSKTEALPDCFGRLSLLEDLDMSRCGELKKLPDSFGDLGKLKTLDISGSGIEGLPETFGRLSLLEYLDLHACGELKKLPDSFGDLGKLKTLYISWSGIEGLPETFGRLSLLEDLGIFGCGELKKLPDSFGDFGKLKTLNISESGIESLPETFGRLSLLEDLGMSGCGELKKLPDSFGDLGKLRILDISDSGIESLPKSFGRLSLLEDLIMSGCGDLKKLPDSFGDLGKLKTLDISRSGIESLLETFGRLSLLENLNMIGCFDLKKLPDSFGDLGNLTTLVIFASGIESLPETFGRLSLLEDLGMSGCDELKKLPDSFGDLGKLKSLHISESGIESLPETVGRLSLLQDLGMFGCGELKKLPDSFGDLGKLKTLNISRSGIESLPETFGRLSLLEDLDMSGCSGLKKLPDSFGDLGRLKTLAISMSGIEGLPESFDLSLLEDLDMSGCSELKKLSILVGTLED